VTEKEDCGDGSIVKEEPGRRILGPGCRKGENRGKRNRRLFSLSYSPRKKNKGPAAKE